MKDEMLTVWWKLWLCVKSGSRKFMQEAQAKEGKE
jgi:hypothetical protein